MILCAKTPASPNCFNAPATRRKVVTKVFGEIDREGKLPLPCPLTLGKRHAHRHHRAADTGISPRAPFDLIIVELLRLHLTYQFPSISRQTAASALPSPS